MFTTAIFEDNLLSRRPRQYVSRALMFSKLCVDISATLGLTVYHGCINLAKIWLPRKFYKDVRGQVVIITGAGSGIGRLMALKLAERGAIIVSVDINTRGNEETVRMIQKIGGTAYAYTCDISKRLRVYETMDKIKEEFGDCSILVNNAGIVSGNGILDIPDEKVNLTFDVNVLAHFWTIKSLLPAMIEEGRGHIVNVASLAGHQGGPNLSDYCASKFAAVGRDEALRQELIKDGLDEQIKLTIVNPFFINTGMFDGAKSKVVPILEPEYVAQRTVDAILTELECVILPDWVGLILGLKYILPNKALLFLLKSLGSADSMTEFKGRADKKKN